VAALLAGIGTGLTSTSANRPGGRTAPGIGAILKDFADGVADGTLLVLDGGVLGNVPPSTIVDCTRPTERPRVIREGAIPVAELRAAAGTLAP
jgi:tRNA A37 threonylcarbamoyladenosine synthetase subunit TsaC/SUA5/YrdC